MHSLLQSLKIPVLTVFISLLLFFGFTKIFGPIPFTIHSIQTTNADLFTVTGVGEVQATPEDASVSLGVTKTGTTAEEAQNEVNTIMNKLLSDLETLGIEKKSIQTNAISVNPTYDYTNGRQKITGYEATQNVTIKVTDVSLANQVVDTATQDGANVISGVSFVIKDEDREKIEKEARVKAIKAAKEKAQQIAQETGITLGRIVNVQVENGQEPPVIMQQRSASDEFTKTEPTNLQPGENTVRVTVHLSYETL